MSVVPLPAMSLNLYWVGRTLLLQLQQCSCYACSDASPCLYVPYASSYHCISSLSALNVSLVILGCQWTLMSGALPMGKKAMFWGSGALLHLQSPVLNKKAHR